MVGVIGQGLDSVGGRVKQPHATLERFQRDASPQADAGPAAPSFGQPRRAAEVGRNHLASNFFPHAHDRRRAQHPLLALRLVKGLPCLEGSGASRWLVSRRRAWLTKEPKRRQSHRRIRHEAAA